MSAACSILTRAKRGAHDDISTKILLAICEYVLTWGSSGMMERFG